MGYELFIAGARGTRAVCDAEYLEFGGDTSCYVLTDGSYALVIDCGTGIHKAKPVIKNCKKVDIILTHMHYDHIIGLLNRGAFPNKVNPSVYGMFKKWGVDDSEKGRSLFDKPFWPVKIPLGEQVEVEWGEIYHFGTDGEIELELYEANHPDYTSIIRFKVGDKEVLVMSDYEHGKPVQEDMIRPYDILIYDGTYTDEEYEECVGYGHSTIKEGIKMANRMGAKKLVITHLNPHHTDRDLRKLEAGLQEELPNGVLARAGTSFKLSE